MEAAILFPLGVRLSTWITLTVFVGFSLRHRDRHFLIAGLVWMTSFEAAYDVTSWAMHPAHWYMNVLFFCVSVFTVFWFRNSIPRPNLWLMGGVAAIWAFWVATGYHVNTHTLHDLSPMAETLNEGDKTLWALAYLIPLIQSTRETSASPQGQEGSKGLQPIPD